MASQLPTNFSELGTHELLNTLRAVEGEVARRHLLEHDIASLALTSSATLPAWLETEYDANLVTLSKLQYDISETPSLEAIQDRLGDAATDWLIDRGTRRCKDRLVIAPSWPSPQGIEQNTGVFELVCRFNKLGGLAATNVVLDQPVETYYRRATLVDSPLHWRVAVLLGDVADPRDTRNFANEFGEYGLVYPDMTVEDQFMAFYDEKASLADKGVSLGATTAGDMLVADARRRLAGETPLNRRTFTRVLQEQAIAPSAHTKSIPKFGARGQQVHISDSLVNLHHPSHGIRRTLNVDSIPTSLV